MALHICDPVTVTMRFERPATEEALARAINGMIGSLPVGRDGKTRVQITLEGIPNELAAMLETAFAIGKAQMAVKAKRRNKK